MLAQENITSRNLVKVIFAENGKVLYFSRATVPFDFKEKIKYYRDLSIVSFIPKMLTKYSKLKLGFNEKTEGIELIRALENDMKIGTFIATNSGFAVDVNQDLMRAINIMPNNKIRKNIKSMSKKVLILGASSEIGVEIMKLYLKKNHKIIAHYNKGNKKFFHYSKDRNVEKIKFNFLTKSKNIDNFSKKNI